MQPSLTQLTLLINDMMSTVRFLRYDAYSVPQLKWGLLIPNWIPDCLRLGFY